MKLRLTEYQISLINSELEKNRRLLNEYDIIYKGGWDRVEIMNDIDTLEDILENGYIDI